MRICIDTRTKTIIEMQSDATAGTLIQNALNAGYSKTDIQELEVTPAQYESLKALDPAQIAYKTAQDLKLQTITDKETAITTNLPSWELVATAVDNITSLAEAKAFMKKLSRVVYWLAKNSEI